MDFGEVLTKAWKIIWKNKVLWIFGFLAGCGRSGGGGGNGGGSSNYQGQGFTPRAEGLYGQAEQFFNQVEHFMEQVPVWVYILVALAALVLIVISIFLSTIGRIGLIRGAADGDEGAERLSFGRVWNESLPYFWRVFLLDICVIVVAILAVLVLMAPFIILSIATMGIGMLCLIPILCVLIPVFWAFSVLIEQTTIAMVLENRGILDGLKRAWQMIKANWGPVLVMSLILIFGAGIIQLLISLPAIAIVLPVLLSLMAQTRAALTAGIGISLILLLIYLPIAIVLNSVLMSYVGTAWTLTYRRLTLGKPAPESIVIPPTNIAGTGY
jgi:hypothetical protein